MKTQQIHDKAILECYTELYRLAEPPLDFAEHIKTAKLNNAGQRIIPFTKHTLSRKKQDAIIDGIAKKYKFDKSESAKFYNTITLGSSPDYPQSDKRY